MESLYRSPSAAVRHPRGVTRSPAFCVEGTEVAVGLVDDWWLDRARVPVMAVGGSGELRSKIEGARGAAPADGLLGVGPISFLGTSVCCGLSKRSREGAPSDLGGGGRNRRSSVVASGAFGLQEVWGPRCNFFFLEGLFARWVGQLSCLSLNGVSVLVLYVFLNF